MKDRTEMLILLVTRPHIQVGDIYLRILIVMYEGRYVVTSTSNRSLFELENLGLIGHPLFVAALHWTDSANARRAKKLATEAIDRLMSL